MELILYTSDTSGVVSNCLYPNKRIIKNAAEMAEAGKFDQVFACYKDSYRSFDNFIESYLIPQDIDNDSDDPKTWKTAKDLEEEFFDIEHVIIPSRHNMLPKGSKSARPRYHILFPCQRYANPVIYTAVKTALQKKYPFFDQKAQDAARFFFGSDFKESDVIWHDGFLQIDEILDDEDMLGEEIAKEEAKAEASGNFGGVILEGSRNNTMSRFAGRVLKKYGICDKAHNLFMGRAEQCDPPLEDSELNTIWNSACKFFRSKVVTQEGYVAPDEYNNDFPGSLKPKDYSDIGQAKVLAQEYGCELIYTSETDFLRYDGTVWVEDKQLAVGATVEFLDLQLQDAGDSLSAAKEKLIKAGVSKEAVSSGSKAIAKEIDTPDKIDAFENFVAASQYFSFVMKRRDMKYITSAMNVAKALLNHSINDMDKNPNLLNTPEGTFDLTSGTEGMKAHRAEDRITKLTECSPGDKGEKLWRDSLNLFFCGDKDLIQYVKRVVGMAAVGKVYQEHLIIAYGDGANGKSTFWNTIARALGTYSGKISAEVLAVGNKRNVKPEMAELKGKRLIIASEMEEGMRLNTGTVKQLCSIDPIQAEKKYEKPFSFIPTHTLVLYTNHLPRVGANDDGIWRRLVVIPFNAKISGKNDVKNYADTLFVEAGPAIIKWIIEGAKEAIALEFKWPLPKQVQDAINEYREQNDWFSTFMEDCCEVGIDYTEKSGAFYDEYRNYCSRVGEYTRNSADFYSALEKAGFKRRRTSSGRLIIGVRLKSDFME